MQHVDPRTPTNPSHWTTVTRTYRDGLVDQFTMGPQQGTAAEQQQDMQRRLRYNRRIRFEHGPGWVQYDEAPPSHPLPCTVRQTWDDIVPNATYWQPTDLAQKLRPRRGNHVRVYCDDTTDSTITASMRAERVVKLGCGCWRIEGDRPGPGVGAGMHALTGCARHARYVLEAPGMHQRPILRQEALNVVSDNPKLATQVDAEWRDDPAETVGVRMERMDDLCVAVLRRNGYPVREHPAHADPWGDVLPLVDAGVPA